MLSRVAETIYWIGRYQERAENIAHLITVNTNLMLDLPSGVAPGWDVLIHLLGCHEFYLERHPEFTERRVANFLISDES
ncbi:MAG: alpha-E domain-containing protein, partial [Candidatus Thiodiazotropha sp. 4PDIVS1]